MKKPQFYQNCLDYATKYNAKLRAEGGDEDSDSYLFVCPFCGGVGKMKWGESQFWRQCHASHEAEYDYPEPAPDIEERLWEMAKYWSKKGENG